MYRHSRRRRQVLSRPGGALLCRSLRLRVFARSDCWKRAGFTPRRKVAKDRKVKLGITRTHITCVRSGHDLIGKALSLNLSIPSHLWISGCRESKLPENQQAWPVARPRLIFERYTMMSRKSLWLGLIVTVFANPNAIR